MLLLLQGPCLSPTHGLITHQVDMRLMTNRQSFHTSDTKEKEAPTKQACETAIAYKMSQVACSQGRHCPYAYDSKSEAGHSLYLRLEARSLYSATHLSGCQMSIYQKISQLCQQGGDTMKRHKPLQDNLGRLVNICLQG